jgi:hypothetical protein
VKSFRSLVVLKRPQHEMWEIMRDHLVEFAGQVADIQEVSQISRSEQADGTVHIVNQWRARQQVPAALRSMLKIDEFGWIDRNVWDATTGISSWTIEPGFLREHIACSGETAFAEAMAGRGTRITFSGELDLKPGALGALGSMELMVTGFLESVVTTIIPRNLRSVAEAAVGFERPG